jgi:putative polysaccharide biosynthesis protein
MRSPFARTLRVGRLLRRAARAHGASVFAVTRRAARLYRVEGFNLREAASLGLLDPAVHEQELGLYTSRRALRPVQARLNADGLSPLTEDKGLFYLFCRHLRLPIPALYALFYRGAAGWGRNGIVVDRGEWRAVLERLPEEFVVKPARASFGLGVTLIRREAEAFVDHVGRRLSADQLLDRLERDPQHNAFVVQERLRNHAKLIALSGSDTLQTARIHTLLERNGPCRVLEASLKIVSGDAVVDNIHGGRNGNLIAPISLEDGRLGPAFLESIESLGLIELAAHPRTGNGFEDVVLPDWAAALELVQTAAAAFAPLRALGWDVALTPRGPVIVEANMWWGPPNQCGTMPVIMRAIADDVACLPEGKP